MFDQIRFEEFAVRDELSRQHFKESLGIFGIDSLSFMSDRMFSVMDINGDGKISRHEYVKALQILDIPAEISEIVAESVFSKYDTNKDGGIDKAEFLKYFSQSNVSIHERVDRAVFERYW